MEEKRLDTMMEVERHKALEMTDRIDEQRREQRVRWAQRADYFYGNIHRDAALKLA